MSDSVIESHIESFVRHDRLSKEKEMELLTAVHSDSLCHDERDRARNLLISHHIPFAAHMAGLHSATCRATAKELLGEALIGVDTGITKFRMELLGTVRLISCLGYHIHCTLMKSTHGDSNLPYPDDFWKYRRKVNREILKLEEAGEHVDVNSIMDDLGVPHIQRRRFIAYGRQSVPMHGPVGFDETGDELTLEDVLPSDSLDQMEGAVQSNDICNRISRIMPKVQSDICKQTAGLGGLPKLSNREVSETINRSEEWVRRHKNKGMKAILADKILRDASGV